MVGWPKGAPVKNLVMAFLSLPRWLIVTLSQANFQITHPSTPSQVISACILSSLPAVMTQCSAHLTLFKQIPAIGFWGFFTTFLNDRSHKDLDKQKLEVFAWHSLVSGVSLSSTEFWYYIQDDSFLAWNYSYFLSIFFADWSWQDSQTGYKMWQYLCVVGVRSGSRHGAACCQACSRDGWGVALFRSR